MPLGAVLAPIQMSRAKSHATGVLRLGVHRFQQLSIAVDQAGMVRLLLANPPAFGCYRESVRITFRAPEHFFDSSLADRRWRRFCRDGLRPLCKGGLRGE